MNASYRVLVVEDNEIVADFYERMLPRHGFLIIKMLADGHEAVSFYRQFRDAVDLLVLDHRLTGQSGLDTAKEILAYDPSAPILMASADEGVKDEALEAGVRAFLSKPFPVADFVAQAKRIVGSGEHAESSRVIADMGA